MVNAQRLIFIIISIPLTKYIPHANQYTDKIVNSIKTNKIIFIYHINCNSCELQRFHIDICHRCTWQGYDLVLGFHNNKFPNTEFL